MSEEAAWDGQEYKQSSGVLGVVSQWFPQERRKMPDPSTMAVQLDSMHKEVREVRSSVNALTEAVGRLSLIEERQANNKADTDRVFEKLEKLEAAVTRKQDDLDTRVKAIELQLPLLTAQSNNSTKWIGHAITGILAATAMFIAQQTGLLS